MRAPILEIRLRLPYRGAGWEYSIRQHGEVVAVSDADYPQPGPALQAAIIEVKEQMRLARARVEGEA